MNAAVEVSHPSSMRSFGVDMSESKHGLLACLGLLGCSYNVYLAVDGLVNENLVYH